MTNKDIILHCATYYFKSPFFLHPDLLIMDSAKFTSFSLWIFLFCFVSFSSADIIDVTMRNFDKVSFFSCFIFLFFGKIFNLKNKRRESIFKMFFFSPEDSLCLFIFFISPTKTMNFFHCKSIRRICIHSYRISLNVISLV